MDLTRRALQVAPELLGCVLRVRGIGVRIVEVEAYEGADDPASHAWQGPTARNASMFEAGGRIYVYTLHGHACLNVVCGPEGVASAVLVRAGEVVEGIEEARERRPGVRDVWLARGPGNLCRALGVTRADDGTVLGSGGIELVPGAAPAGVRAGVRVNVSRAFARPWRFWDAGSASVSAAKLHPAARAAAPRQPSG
ncbi:DNA-3-methyladenine glycosylase [Propioniciclava sinopodophylli]|uniref:DNA-3-methyladenine glycosylase n=1 Tax=Propioniciclava sinopodophylli TaxID=1837344 RepID=UPI0024916F64|nr:DNA-3-methyladenine glycosylase [Propioniciclava sinopodophylli]